MWVNYDFWFLTGCGYGYEYNFFQSLNPVVKPPGKWVRFMVVRVEYDRSNRVRIWKTGMQSPRGGAIFLQGASPWLPAGAGAGRTDYRYLFVGIRYFSVFELSTSISVSVFQNIALSVWFFGIPITSSWTGRMTYVVLWYVTLHALCSRMLTWRTCRSRDIVYLLIYREKSGFLDKMPVAFCGPKLSACCAVLSLWGIIMLASYHSFCFIFCL